MANVKIILIGNLVADADKKTKKDSDTNYHLFTVAITEKKDVTKYYTCFAYGISEARAKMLTKGSLVEVIGFPDEKINLNPKSNENEIQRTVQVLNFDILYHKKPGDVE